MTNKNPYFNTFNQSTENISLPERFTFPFYYSPHPLAIQAAHQLQEYLRTQTDFSHNFGIDEEQDGMVIGKMFGVLVVQNEVGELGFLAGFSGKLADSNHHEGFVPPVYDMLSEGSFFNEGAKELNVMNARVRELEASDEFAAVKVKLREATEEAKAAIEQRRLERVANRADRKIRREQNEVLEAQITRESLQDKHEYNELIKRWNERIEGLQAELDVFTNEITSLKEQRKAKSNDLQQRIFDNYHFLNQRGEEQSLWQIFHNELGKVPPAGAGECAAPKLVQYAYLHRLKPIALAEFWWGESPKSEIRRHGHFYPACRGKCEPILGHMLKGLDVDDNPMLLNPAVGKSLEIVYEDDAIVVVNKPAEFLSVPGKTITDCVYTRIQHKYPKATGPLIIHRLDMATSGILLLAKTKQAHKYLQYQFIHRTIEKQYIALLDGIVEEDEGKISLPLRLDIDDRPRQLVCYEYGRPAETHWKVLDRTEKQTRIQFHPITGRSHQLRVHAAHSLGLNASIVGDDLYGTKANRLHLHAASITFEHPETKEKMTVDVAPDF